MAEITNFRGEHAGAEPDDALEGEVRALMRRVGERVKKARDLKGYPRRVVAEKSGVSLRYLAQLESGAGNISIGLLQRVALALELKIEWLVGEDDPWTSDALRLADLYRAASADSRERALAALGAPGPEDRRAGRVCLLGLRGAGKSTLGAMAAETLRIPFLELNAEIEQEAGMPVSEVFGLYGQEGYRRLETRALERIVALHESAILAVGGGIVAEPETFKLLLANFRTIWIKAGPEEHMRRVLRQGDTRPMAGNPEAMAQLRTILESRRPLYERAEATLDTSGKPLETSARELVSLIRAMGITNEAATAPPA